MEISRQSGWVGLDLGFPPHQASPRPESPTLGDELGGFGWRGLPSWRPEAPRGGPAPAWTALQRMLQPRGRDPQAIAGASCADWVQP